METQASDIASQGQVIEYVSAVQGYQRRTEAGFVLTFGLFSTQPQCSVSCTYDAFLLVPALHIPKLLHFTQEAGRGHDLCQRSWFGLLTSLKWNEPHKYLRLATPIVETSKGNRPYQTQASKTGQQDKNSLEYDLEMCRQRNCDVLACHADHTRPSDLESPDSAHWKQATLASQFDAW